MATKNETPDQTVEQSEVDAMYAALQADEQANPVMADIIRQCELIFDEKAAVYEKLANARTLVRSLAGMGQASPAQAEYVKLMFPVKQRGVRRNGSA